MFEGRTFCQRHVNLARALKGSPSRHMFPDLNNRAANLTAWVSNDLNDDVSELLTTRLDAGLNEVLEVEPMVFNPNPSEGAHRWERAWNIITSSGRTRLKVSVDVAEEESEVLRVCVDSRTIMSSTPPWIRSIRDAGPRPTPEEDLHIRQGYYADVLKSIADAIAQG